MDINLIDIELIDSNLIDNLIIDNNLIANYLKATNATNNILLTPYNRLQPVDYNPLALYNP